PAYSGQSVVAGPEHEQLIFLHGGTLARHDMKRKQQLWSRDLIDHKAIEEEIVKEVKSMQESNLRAADNGMSHPPRIPGNDELKEEMELAAARSMELYVRGQNIWVATPGKLVCYDWANGSPVKEVPVKDGHGQFVARGDELVLMDTYSDNPRVVHVNLVNGETRTDPLGKLLMVTSAGTTTGATSSNLSKAGSVVAKSIPAKAGARSSQMAGLPIGTPGQDAGKPMDPAKVAEQAQNMRYAAKLALPALLANSATQERTLAELNDQQGDKAAKGDAGEGFDFRDRFSLIPDKDGFVQFGVKLLEERYEEHVAMKAAPAKSVLEGPVTAAQSMEVANEILNEMQRSRGGDKVHEDISRYQVTIRRPDSQDVWSGEVIGPPQLHPLPTVNVLTASKMVMVFDKTNKKLWQSALNYNVHGGWSGWDEERTSFGQGPCVERKGTLYVFDEGVLAAFDLATGNARWRLPSVGIAGLFFDAQDMIYVNTTTASHESIKLSRQIDVTQTTGAVILKVDSKTGKVLWSNDTAGMINRIDDKFVYAVQYQTPSPKDDPEDSSPLIRNQPFLRIRCLNPKSGRERWLHYQERGPLDIQFDQNTIRVVFKKEVQVLKFPTF
ncbi:MAG TPA: PQQ-binding-like beta-propeller repeat protein, partial [Bacillota bacterium]|nr:PQQ-binding-like beta-propeller repeat protein [Bacillota bacterium]